MTTFLVLLAGCAGAPRPVPTTAGGEVTLSGWCERVSTEMCNAMATQCFQGNRDVAAGCIDSARTGCVAGREPAMSSGRTTADLDHCTTQLRSLSCEGLGAGLGSGALHECVAQAH